MHGYPNYRRNSHAFEDSGILLHPLRDYHLHGGLSNQWKPEYPKLQLTYQGIRKHLAEVRPLYYCPVRTVSFFSRSGTADDRPVHGFLF